MNRSQLKKFAESKIIPQLKGTYQFNNNLIFQYPLLDLLKGFYFEGSPSSKDIVYIWCFTQPLFVPSENIVFTFGKRLRTPEGKEQWGLMEEFEITTPPVILDTIKFAEQSFLLSVGDKKLFYDHYKSETNQNVKILEAVCYASILLGKNESEDLLIKLIKNIQSMNLNIPWIKKIFDRVILLKENDSLKRKNILEGWKIKTINSLGLNSF